MIVFDQETEDWIQKTADKFAEMDFVSVITMDKPMILPPELRGAV